MLVMRLFDAKLVPGKLGTNDHKKSTMPTDILILQLCFGRWAICHKRTMLKLFRRPSATFWTASRSSWMPRGLRTWKSSNSEFMHSNEISPNGDSRGVCKMLVNGAKWHCEVNIWPAHVIQRCVIFVELALLKRQAVSDLVEQCANNEDCMSVCHM